MTKEATIVGALVAFAAAAGAAVWGESARASFPGEPGRIAFMSNRDGDLAGAGLSATTGASRNGPLSTTLQGKVPCAKLTKQHKPLPTRCRKPATIPVPAGPEELAALPGSVWVASHYDGSATRIDTATSRVVATVRMPGEYPGCCGPQGIAAGEGGVWVAVPGLGGTNLVVRIDPVTSVVSAAIGGSTQTCGALLAAAGAVWVTNAGCGGPGIARIDPATNRVVVRGIGDMIRVTDAVPWTATSTSGRGP
jgi:DNA-binding beta-propeller fold protein YncE